MPLDQSAYSVETKALVFDLLVSDSEILVDIIATHKPAFAKLQKEESDEAVYRLIMKLMTHDLIEKARHLQHRGSHFNEAGEIEPEDTSELIHTSDVLLGPLDSWRIVEEGHTVWQPVPEIYHGRKAIYVFREVGWVIRRSPAPIPTAPTYDGISKLKVLLELGDQIAYTQRPTKQTRWKPLPRHWLGMTAVDASRIHNCLIRRPRHE